MTNPTKKINPILFLCFAIFIFSCSNESPQTPKHENKLWYNQPAQNWEEALPLGNGRLGVMVFGNPTNERIQLNDDSMWPADNKAWNEPSGNKDDLNNIRALLFKGENTKADSLFVNKFSRKTVVRSHQTLGDLFIDFNHKNITDYRRELNINNATSSVSYKTNGNRVTENIFVSHPHNAIIIEFESEAENGLNGKVRLTRPEDHGFPTATAKTTDNNLLVMQGEVTQRGGKFDSKPFPILNGVKFETQLKIKNADGEILKGEDYLELKNVKKATFYMVSNSSYYHENFAKQNNLDLENVLKTDIKTIKKEHIKDYQNLYSKVALNLNNTELDSIPTDERIKRIKNDSVDVALEALLFQYGRYLLISSSRENTNPANLQGLWNKHIEAPWNADYHLNINLQMNYWLANVTNLDELNIPLFDYVDKLVENGKTTAQKNFGCRGSFLPHATDLWAPTWLRAPTAYWGCSVGAGGWMMQHYWQHYEFTKDIEFLKNRAFPAIKEVAMFYSDWLIEDPRDGTLISAPSTSPENRFFNAEEKPVATCLGSAMDQQVIAEVFHNYIEACKILNIKNELLTKIKAQQEQLRPGFVIGDESRILEWDRPYKETEPGHRHMSHLYGFHPGVQVTEKETPEIFKAVKNTLDYRLANGGAGTGWSRAWLINCSARLLDGDMAHEHVQLLFKKSMFNNLFDAHPPFQIDGNFGYSAGIAEMLLQSHEKNTIRILPALPKAWKNGEVKGLKARGGLTVDITWSNNKLEEVVINSEHDHDFKMIYLSEEIPVSVKKGERFEYSAN